MFDEISYIRSVDTYNLQVWINEGDHSAPAYVRQCLNVRVTNIVKNIPEQHVSMCRLGVLPRMDRYNDSFKACTHASQQEIVQEIAYPP